MRAGNYKRLGEGRFYFILTKDKVPLQISIDFIWSGDNQKVGDIVKSDSGGAKVYSVPLVWQI